MPGLLDYLGSNYANAALQRDPNAGAAQTGVDPNSPTLLSMLSSFFSPAPGAVNGALLRNPNAAVGTPVAVPATSMETGSPMGFGSAVIPQQGATVPPELADSQAAAQARGEAEYWAATTPEDRAATAQALGYVPKRPAGAAVGGLGLTSASVPTATQDLGPTVNVADGDASGTAGTGQVGGILGALAPAAADAATSPEKSKTLLGALGATISGIGDKLTNLNPNASQALIASGLTMLAGNDGTRNLGQLVGLGGIAGLNSYDANRQAQAVNALAAQKANQEQQHWATETALKAQQQNWEQRKPVTVSQDQSLVNPVTGQPIVQAQPGVARTAEVQGPDGNTYTVQLDRTGNIVGQPLLKSNPNIGPLGDQQQKTVNDAQTAAASAKQTYQSTAYLANQLANAPDFSSGFGASINDTLTKLTGNKDAGQQLRGQLSQFANSSILGELPPGSASDKDIQLVRNGVPSDTASKETWQAYLSAVGRVQQIAAVYQNAKADFVTANRGNLGPLARDATINGIQYPAGTSFAQASSGQPPAQQQPQANTGAISISSLQAEARRRGLIK